MADGSETLDTFVPVTTPANKPIGPITDRVPAILKPEDWPLWLCEPDAPLADVKALLQTFEEGGDWTMEPQPTNERPSKAMPEVRPSLFWWYQENYSSAVARYGAPALGFPFLSRSSVRESRARPNSMRRTNISLASSAISH